MAQPPSSGVEETTPGRSAAVGLPAHGAWGCLALASPVNSPEKLRNWPEITSSDVGADLEDWRTPLLRYLRDPSAKIDKSVRRSTFKYAT